MLSVVIDTAMKDSGRCVSVVVTAVFVYYYIRVGLFYCHELVFSIVTSVSCHELVAVEAAVVAGDGMEVEELEVVEVVDGMCVEMGECGGGGGGAGVGGVVGV